MSTRREIAARLTESELSQELGKIVEEANREVDE